MIGVLIESPLNHGGNRGVSMDVHHELALCAIITNLLPTRFQTIEPLLAHGIHPFPDGLAHLNAGRRKKAETEMENQQFGGKGQEFKHGKKKNDKVVFWYNRARNQTKMTHKKEERHIYVRSRKGKERPFLFFLFFLPSHRSTQC